VSLLYFALLSGVAGVVVPGFLGNAGDEGRSKGEKKIA